VLDRQANQIMKFVLLAIACTSLQAAPSSLFDLLQPREPTGVAKAIQEETRAALRRMFPTAGPGPQFFVQESEIAPQLFYFKFHYTFWNVKDEISARREEFWNSHLDQLVEAIQAHYSDLAPFSVSRSFAFESTVAEISRADIPHIWITIRSLKNKQRILLAEVDLEFINRPGDFATFVGTVIYRRATDAKQ
jgi:hypothetical protein